MIKKADSRNVRENLESSAQSVFPWDGIRSKP